jgi:chromosome segregation ATPase
MDKQYSVNIPLSEYERLVKENQDLRNKVIELSSVNNAFIELLKNKDKTIEELKSENEELKARITELEANNIQLTKKNESLTIRIDNLETEIKNIKNEKIFAKFVIGIRDLNTYEKLDNKVLNKFEKTILKRLRYNRISYSHYLDDEFEKQEKEIRRNILIDKLNNAEPEIIDKFEKIYPGLLDTLKPHLEKRDVILDDETVIWANNWWEI